MIRFFISKQEILVPEEFEFTQIDENAMLTNSGECTLDISISLIEPVNAKTFKHINRLNTMSVNSTFEGCIIDNMIVKFGTVIIISHTNTEVKIQYVFGNSELNYNAKSDGRKIWELNWGSEESIDFNKAKFTILHPGYGEVRFFSTVLGFNNYVCPPVKVGDEILNEWLIDNQENDWAIKSSVYNITEEVPLTQAGYYTLQTAIQAVPSGVRALAFVIEFNSSETDTVRYQYKHYSTSSSNWANSDNWVQVGTKFVMQPYLLYYINKMPELLGYTLKHNELNTDSRAKITYLVNNVNSLNYADCLPDWTVTEFITYVEDFFNVCFIVNQRDKTLSIHNVASYISQKKKVKLTHVLDSYSRDLTSDRNATRFGFDTIGYDVASNDYFKNEKFADSFLELCEIKEFANKTELNTYIEAHPELLKSLIIYRDMQTSYDYYVNVTFDGYSRTGVRDTVYTIKLFNMFRDYSISKGKTLTLKIVPAAMYNKSHVINDFPNGETGGGTSKEFNSQMPLSGNSFAEPKLNTIPSLLSDGDSSISRSDKMEISLYTGILYLFGEGSRGVHVDYVLYPFSHNDTSVCFGAFDAWLTHDFLPKATKSLRIVGPNGIMEDYYQSQILDISCEYGFEIPDHPEINSDNLFEFQNKTYVPIKFERTRSSKAGNVVKGTFYRML